MTTIDVLRLHVDRISRENRVPYVEQVPGQEHRHPVRARSGALRRLDGHQFVHIPKVKDESSYAVALHEFGHALGQDQGTKRSSPLEILLEEAGAWDWAEENALIWTEDMTACRTGALLSYLEGLRMGRVQLAKLMVASGVRYQSHVDIVYPDNNHSLWTMVGWTQDQVRAYKLSGAMPVYR